VGSAQQGGGALTRAVVFDLFETLVDYDDTRSREFSAEVARLCGREPEEFHRIWRNGRPVRETGPMVPYLASLGIGETEMEEFLEARRAFAREVLGRPRKGAVETLRELRSRGLRTGLITVCSEDTVDVWSETPFAGLFDAEVFSCSCGWKKPDPRIYELACERLDVRPGEAIFVGDGANDELAGAERVGMRAILIHRPGTEPAWPEVRDWPGPRITSIPDVLSFV
jgi:putative hydrolase of the HAD superfamily